jgi:hypothetical protein
VFLRCQAHFSNSHRRRGLPGGPFFRRPARARIGVRGKEFRGCAEFHAPHPHWLLPLAKGSCPFEVSIPFDATWRSPASASTISYIKHSKMKTPGGRIACGALAPVYKKRFRKFRLKITMPNRREQGGRERMHHRLSSALMDAVLTGGAPLVRRQRPGSRFGVASSAAVRTSRDPTTRRDKARRASSSRPSSVQRLELRVIAIQAREKAQ